MSSGKSKGWQRIVATPVVLSVALTVGSAVQPARSPAADNVAPTPEGNEKPLIETRCPVRDPQHIFQRGVWSWRELKDKNVVKQNRDYSCGAASLCTLLKYYWGDNVTEQKVLDTLDKMLTPAERKDRIQNGVSLTDLRKVCVKLGYVASIGTLSFDQLSQSKIPVLVGLKIGKFYHFAVFRGTDGYWVYLADPARGNVRGPIKEFVDVWQKQAILVVAKKDQDIKEDSPLSLKPEEIYLGTLNRVVIQKLVAQPLSGQLPSGVH
ncbi:MAG TPA: cysteine peptidase family C39 domain-containing protein [Planctomycetaceae bacterium]|jgi:predicted double-glycine peptidase|nr:cysteine peptidase family C39 domain-containing protein [Planctomycetaceae bacterium]